MSLPITSEITSTYHGEIIRLVHSATFQLLEREGTIEIQLQGGLSFKIRITFQYIINANILTDIKIYKEGETSVFNFTCTNWLSDTGVELKNPYYFHTKDNKTRGYLKIRASGNNLVNFRTVDISVWLIQN